MSEEKTDDAGPGPGRQAFITVTEDDGGNLHLGFASNREVVSQEDMTPAEEAALGGMQILQEGIEGKMKEARRIVLPPYLH